MPNILVTIRFVGTAYHGSQIQQNAETVQAVFQRALAPLLDGPPNIKCCSRTDTGVHANMFCISVHTEAALSAERLTAALNNRLPFDIRVLCIQPVPEDFHARYSSTGKRYLYQIYNAPVFDPFHIDRAAHFIRPIDVAALQQAADVFVGTHDFRAFCSRHTDAGDTTRTVESYIVTREGPLVRLTVTADGFLYNMARAMAGALLNVARGRLTAADIAERLDNGMRDHLIATAPACGLYLDRVFYREIDPLAGFQESS